MGKKGLEMVEKPIEGFFWRTRTLTRLSAMELFWRREQRPAPAIFVAMLICGIDAILRDHATGHLQTGNVAIEATAHLRTCKTTGSAQFTGDQRSLFL